MAKQAKTSPRDTPHLTYGYLLKRFKTYSETSKWFLGGTAAIFLFGFDKLGMACLQLVAFILAGVGVICFALAHLADKGDADRWEYNIEKDELGRKPEDIVDAVKKDELLRTKLHPQELWKESDGRPFYIVGLWLLVALAILVFVVSPLCKQHEKPLCCKNCTNCCVDTTKKR